MDLEDEEDGNNLFVLAGWHVQERHIPYLFGTLTAVVLLFVFFLAYIIWQCCAKRDNLDSKPKKPKQREFVEIETVDQRVPHENVPGVFLDPVNRNFVYGSRIVELIPERESRDCQEYLDKNYTLRGVCPEADKPSRHHRHSFVDVESRKKSRRQGGKMCEEDCSLPQISEFSAHPCQYASSSILDECASPEVPLHLRTRSLPSNARKKRPVSSAEDPEDIYDKVNFSKKRKNRMRNDEAAIIAMSKSRSQFFEKDTDILVENEAIIVYDERTAL